jgi:hypothetical protein
VRVAMNKSFFAEAMKCTEKVSALNVGNCQGAYESPTVENAVFAPYTDHENSVYGDIPV